jgi:hypothetical protein
MRSDKNIKGFDKEGHHATYLYTVTKAEKTGDAMIRY